LTITDKW